MFLQVSDLREQIQAAQSEIADVKERNQVQVGEKRVVVFIKQRFYRGFRSFTAVVAYGLPSKKSGGSLVNCSSSCKQQLVLFITPVFALTPCTSIGCADSGDSPSQYIWE